jgi:predicted ATP-binding protein involved in virulence
MAYQGCLKPDSDQRMFQSWFKQLSLVALQQGSTIPALAVVTNALLKCIPDSTDFYFDIANDQLMIRFEKEGLMPFNNLSDGYRNMVSMVADIDMHLHPKWQRTVIDSLKNFFEQIQFIVTTHSPFVLQSLAPGEVIDLNTLDQVDTVQVGEYSQRSIEDIIEAVMGVEVPQRSQRHQNMHDAAKKYYAVLQDAQLASSQEKAQLKSRLDELSAPFSDNVAYHAIFGNGKNGSRLGQVN